MRQKIDYEIIKDNYRNKVTKKILTDFTQKDDMKFNTKDYKYARIQDILD